MARAKVQAGPDTLLADEIEAFFKDDFQYFIMFFNTLPQYLAIQQVSPTANQDCYPTLSIRTLPVEDLSGRRHKHLFARLYHADL